MVTDGILYMDNKIFVPNNDMIRLEIVRSRHDSLLTGHPGRQKTFSLVERQYHWPKVRAFVNRYVDSCDSCQRVKSTTLRPFGSLKPLPIPAGP